MEKFFVKNLNTQGRLLTAKKIFLRTLLELKNQKKKVFVSEFLEKTLSNVQPKIGFRNKKVAGMVYKIPTPYQNIEKLALAGKWITDVSKNSKGQALDKKLSRELLDTFSNKSETLKKKKEIHRLALANKANLKYM